MSSSAHPGSGGWPATPGTASAPQPGADTRRLALWLWAACLLAVTHGSLYPWQFQGSASFASGWYRLWHQSTWWTSNGDVLGNVLLFLPVGALSAALLRGTSWGLAARLALVLAAGVLFAFALQVLQIWLPRRSPAFSDVIWNAAGLLMGLPLAAALQPPLSALLRLWRAPHRAGLWMALLWLAIAWWPLLPVLSGAMVRQTWRELDRVAQADTLAALAPALGAALVLHLVRNAPWRAALVPALPLLALLGQFVFVHPSSWVSHLLGWLVGVVLGALSWHWTAARADRLMLVAVALVALVSALLPWQWSATPAALNGLPLDALLSSHRPQHSLALMWDLFWVGSVLVLAQHLRWPLLRVALGLTVLLLLREWLQRWMPMQQADITPVLLPWLCWALVRPRA
ncbi:MAG: VanZ family protein [Rubrivivax sp.]|nr:VanZ family protein [Rubrivivax sp.]